MKSYSCIVQELYLFHEIYQLNQIFSIIAVLRQSVQQQAGPIAWQHSSEERSSGWHAVSDCVRFDWSGKRTLDLPHQ